MGRGDIHHNDTSKREATDEEEEKESEWDLGATWKKLGGQSMEKLEVIAVRN